MKIQDVCNQTGLTKRNIHFYIKEGLIFPAARPNNGYYDFSDDDCRRLTIIRELRNADFSIPIIRSILNNPATAGYYLQRHAKQLKREEERLTNNINELSHIIEFLPLRSDMDTLCSLIHGGQFAPPASKDNAEPFGRDDTALVNRFLWSSFIPDTPLTDYQQFLWEKVNRITECSIAADYEKISGFLQTLSQKNIDTVLARRNQHYEYIASLNQEGCIQYVNEMRQNIKKMLMQNSVIQRWKYMYHPYILPNTRIFDSEINTLMGELSPLFSAYLHNIHIVCESLYQWLHSENGGKFLQEMNRQLTGYINLEHCHHGELEALAAFHILITDVMDVIYTGQL